MNRREGDWHLARERALQFANCEYEALVDGDSRVHECTRGELRSALLSAPSDSPRAAASPRPTIATDAGGVD